jgi:hypothetical protein
MTESDDKFSPPAPQTSPQTAKGAHSAWRKILFLFAAMFILVAGSFAAILRLQTHGFLIPVTGNMADASQKVAALELKVETLDNRVTDLSARVDDIAASPPSTDQSRAPKTSAADLAHMQNDLAALAATVNGLQAQAAAARAEAVAFMQLRDAAMSGHGFAHELEALQNTINNDPGLKDSFGKLSPLAGQGAPTEAVLRDQLMEQIVAADEAIAKANAQTWWERVLAELKGLVSVRPLHGPTSTNAALDDMQAALAHDDLGGALEDIKNLPPEAQQKLDGWRQEAEARRSIDDSLRALADRLIAGANATPPVRDAP